MSFEEFITELREKLTENGITHLPIIGEENNVIGARILYSENRAALYARTGRDPDEGLKKIRDIARTVQASLPRGHRVSVSNAERRIISLGRPGDPAAIHVKIVSTGARRKP